MPRSWALLVLSLVAVALVPACGVRVAAPHADVSRAESGAGRDQPEHGAMRPGRPAATAAAATEVLRRYYAAIGAGDYRRAYRLWADDGAASGQTFHGFAAGFDHTAQVRVEVGEPGRIEPAAGSRYVVVPVVIRAVTEGGERQRFEGTYTLRRSVIPGASREQRHWRIYAADITRVRL